MKHQFCVMLQMETDDPRLSVDAIVEALGGGKVSSFAKIRHAIMGRLAHDVTRVVAVFPVEHAMLLMKLHEAFGQEIAAELRQAGTPTRDPFVRPPKDYVPPTRD
jgi:hypothetical protein